VLPDLRRFILGETDSEVLFFLFLSALAEQSAQLSRLDAALEALQKTVQRVRAIADSEGKPPSTLTLMATDGEVLVATHGGKELFLSTFKTRCPDREQCSSLSALSSEPLQGENVWFPLTAGEFVGIDGAMQPRRGQYGRILLPLAG
jgi:glutamine amidotransferase